MENEGKMKKVSVLYLLANIFGPVILVIAGVALGVCLPESIGVVISIVVFGLAILWWAYLGHKMYEKKRDKKLQELQSTGFVSNQTFNADGCTVVVDLAHGQVALLFRWNPGTVYVRPAASLTKVYVDTGRGGAGLMEGSSRVSFLFTVEGIKIRVNTFTSNKRWRMDSDYILTGISKADMMVEALVKAGATKAF